MLILLTIFQYLIQAVVDLTDKFLISTRKIQPESYVFYTVVMGLLLLLAWPWFYVALPAQAVFMNLLSGAMFSVALYVFFKALSQGEASRVVPYIFALVPVFDIIISKITGRGQLTLPEVAAMFLLIPGAMLVSFRGGATWTQHVALKTVSALLFSSYYAMWQYAAQSGPFLNNLTWDRVGAASILILALLIPTFRKKVFTHTYIRQKRSTAGLFLVKQVLGGANFVLLSFLFAFGKISIVNALQGFRYVFLLFLGMIITKHRGHLLEEEGGRKALVQKSIGIILIFIGTVILFI